MMRRIASVFGIVAAFAWSAFGATGEYDPNASAEEILDSLLGVPRQPSKPSPWQSELQLRLGGGYARNVLYSPFDEKDSGFSSGEAEFFAMRKGDSPHALHLYTYANQRHYFDLDSDNDETSAIADGGWEYRDSCRGALGLRAHYFFADQFFDTSVSDAEIESSRLTQHDFGSDAYVDRVLLPGVTARLGAGHRFVELQDSDDDYQQLEGLASLSGEIPSRVSVSLQYRYQRDDYDAREKRDAAGYALPGPPVDIQNHQVRLEGAWYWDAGHVWRTRCWVTRRCRDDDGGGYYDYESAQGGVDIRAAFGRWTANLGASYGDMEYDERLSDADDAASDRLWRRKWDTWLRVERAWLRHWTWFAEVNWEDNDANDEVDAYAHLSSMLGVGYVFRKEP